MSLDLILGQEPAALRLKRLLETGRLPPALLFHGPAGVGKTMAALEVAKALNCESGEACGRCPSCLAADKGLDPDLKKVDAAYQAALLDEEPEKQQHIKVETIRHLVRDLEMRSMAGRWKTAIVTEAHTLQAAAANALLKALEEPPPRSLWILVTFRRDQLLPTVLSRCHTVRFRPLPSAVVRRLLAERGFPAREAQALAEMSEGSLGRALDIKKRELPEPLSWLDDPLGPFRLAESLPRELHLSRPLAEDHLGLLSWHVRRSMGPSSSRARRALAAVESLRRALRSNADPRLVVELAALEVQQLPPQLPRPPQGDSA